MAKICNNDFDILHIITVVCFYYYTTIIKNYDYYPLLHIWWAMRVESHFKSYFGNVKAFNLKKFKIIAEPVAAMAGGGLQLGGDGRRIP